LDLPYHKPLLQIDSGTDFCVAMMCFKQRVDELEQETYRLRKELENEKVYMNTLFSIRQII
jgi:hypothetical protein